MKSVYGPPLCIDFAKAHVNASTNHFRCMLDNLMVQFSSAHAPLPLLLICNEREAKKDPRETYKHNMLDSPSGGHIMEKLHISW
jgi:hypothetical protein